MDRWLLELVIGLSEFQTALDECWVDFAEEGSEMRLSREGAVTKAEYRGASWTLPQDELVATSEGEACASCGDDIMNLEWSRLQAD